jgi:8-hydroxy-5-deazaflavin:NADPH oxidoreductase
MSLSPSNSSAPELGILGTGRMGVRLAAMFARAGRRVVLGSRSPERAARIVASLRIPGVSAGDYGQALTAPIVLPAVFIRDGLFDVLDAHAAALAGKVMIDITNPFNEDYSDFIFPESTSGAEELQKRLPRVRVVGAFKNVWWEVFDAPHFEGVVSDVFVVGNDPAAKAAVLELAVGTPFRYVDAGALKNARTIERMTLLMGEIGRRYKYHPRMNWRVLGEPWKSGSADKDGVDKLIERAG